MKRCPRVAIICQKPICLAGLKSLIADSPAFDVVAVSVVPGDVLKLIATHQPDIVLFEFEGQGDLLKLAAATISHYRRTRFIIVAGTVDADRAIYLLDAGAKGYLSLSSTADELLEALQQVADGDSYISPSVASRVIGAMRRATDRRNSIEGYNLSVREEQIARLLCQGKTNREIAKSLGLREKTIKHYMSQMMQKMHVRNRLEVAMAFQPGSSPAAGGARLAH